LEQLFSFDMEREAQRFVTARQITGDFYYQLAYPVARRNKLHFHFHSSGAGVAHADDLRYLFPIHLVALHSQ